MSELPRLRTDKDPARADWHGVHSLDSFVFTVPDLEEARRFYEAFGLDVKRPALKLPAVGRLGMP